MNFFEFENIMRAKGLTTLADIARELNTTPQAVSNWKSRNQVPYHIVAKVTTQNIETDLLKENHYEKGSNINYMHSSSDIDNQINLSDILLTFAEQIKIIVFCLIISVFVSFTYNWSNNELYYESQSKILLPVQGGGAGGMGGLASQIGVNIGQDTAPIDLSNPLLFPDMIKTHSFTEKILSDSFIVNNSKNKKTLFEIISKNKKEANMEIMKREAREKFGSMVSLVKAAKYYELTVKASEPLLARDINIKVLDILQEQSRFYKSQNVRERINFIQSRIKVVENDLLNSEKRLKTFLEKNRQISSPSLILEQERLSREVEIQKGVFLTLKQQLELSNIEKIQTQTIIQVLDPPLVPIRGSGKNLKLIVIMAGLLGLMIGLFFAFIRSFINNANTEQKRKIRRIKSFIKKKCKDFMIDRRITGTMSLLMIIALPLYLGHDSTNPQFFGKYSKNLFAVIMAYLIILISFLIAFIMSYKKNIKREQ
tara:strand:+ start:664 stop:2112 length:1449 start_codon:yes stop_codon:yes gene_type:complete